MREDQLPLSDQEQVRLEKLEALEAQGENPYHITKADQDTHAKEITSDFATYEGKKVKLAGRLMSKRGMGKVSFCDLQDRSGQIQIFSRFDELGEKDFKEWQKLDIGDLVAVEGEVFKTNRGEVSVRNAAYTLLAKCLRPLPEKFHGLQDVDIRFRKRYLDLIVNPDVQETFVKRSKIISTIRRILDDRNYIEVETPILQTIAGGATARPFVTHHNTLDMDLFLRISPELFLKRLIIGGFERVYEIGRNFRNEGMSTKHNPEFTMMELYEAYTDYHGMMEITEILISEACKAVNDGETKIQFDGVDIDLTPPFRRLTMNDAIVQFVGVDFSKIEDLEEAKGLAKEHGLKEEDIENMQIGDIMNLFFEEFCEAKIIQPTFIYDYPIEVSPLTKKKPGSDRLVERFEVFIAGTEYGNAYSELNDPRDQRERFEDQLRRREEGDDEANLPDEDFVEALDYGMVPTGGLGIGIDRLTMLLTDNLSIREVVLFPTMRPLARDASVLDAQASKAFDEIKLEDIDFSKVKVEPLFEDMISFDDFSDADVRAVKVLECEEVPKSRNLLKFTLDDGSDKERVILSGIKDYYNAEDLVGKTLLAICNIPSRKMMGIDSQGMILSTTYEQEGAEKLNLIMLNPRIPVGAKMY